MTPDWPRLLATYHVTASAPCRVDLGGTLDIPTIGMPLTHLGPCTFNLALDLRTRVTLEPWPAGLVRIASRGFETACFPLHEAPFDPPLGLMFAVAAYFRVEGVTIDIDSRSPPRSALGGSSVAAVALVGALTRLASLNGGGKPLDRLRCARLAQQIEAAVAGAPCGAQDQLAAACGGVNAWYWNYGAAGLPFRRRRLSAMDDRPDAAPGMLLAYAGRPHDSGDVNGRWVQGFLRGGDRSRWHRIVELTHAFIAAWERKDWPAAVAAMNAETDLRCQMTPQVLDPVGRQLVDAALEAGCGARFTGAGGGGCIWALGPKRGIAGLRETWQDTLASVPEGTLLPVRTDARGLMVAVVPKGPSDPLEH